MNQEICMKSNTFYKMMLAFLLAFVLFFVSAGYQPAFADTANTREILVYLNGNKIEFDVAPVVIKGRTLVPLRKIFEELGATIEWDKKTRTATATKGDIKFSLQVGSLEYSLNGKKHPLDVPAALVRGRTMIPARLVSEAFGCQVIWDGSTRSVLITGEVGKDSGSNGNTSGNDDSVQSFDSHKVNGKRVLLGLDPRNTIEATIDGAKVRIKGRLEYDEFNQVWVELHHGKDFGNLELYTDALNDRYEVSPTSENLEHSRGFLKLKADRTFDMEVNLVNSPVQSIRVYGIYWAGELNEDLYDGDNDSDKDYVSLDDGYLHIVKKGNEYQFIKAKGYEHNLQVMKTLGNPSDYLSTAHLDPTVRSSLKNLSDQIVKGAKTDREKLLKIHSWMTKNMFYNYDYDNVNDKGINFNAPLDIVQNQTSQCYGFSILFTDLARLQGIPTTKVIGDIRYDVDEKPIEKTLTSLHSWNISYVDGRWIHIDVTWDISNKLQDAKLYRMMPAHAYFDIELSAFSHSHLFDYFRERHEWD